MSVYPINTIMLLSLFAVLCMEFNDNKLNNVVKITLGLPCYLITFVISFCFLVSVYFFGLAKR